MNPNSTDSTPFIIFFPNAPLLTIFSRQNCPSETQDSPCRQIENPNKKTQHWINHISLHKKHRWETLFPFLLPGLTKGKKIVGTRNSLLQHGYISKLLTLKADAQYLLKTSRRRIQVQQSTTDNKITRPQYDYVNPKQNSFHINSVFLFSKTNFMIQKNIIYWL